VVPTAFHVMHYTAESLEEHDLSAPADLARFRDTGGVTWVNVDGLGSTEFLRGMGEVFGFHPLALEDVLSVPQRPKADDYSDHLFLVIRMPDYQEQLEIEQISMFLGRNVVVTFQQRPGDCLEPIRERLRKSTGRLRQEGADYLMYAILDAVIDHYFPFLELLGETVEELEDEVMADPDHETLGRVHEIKRDLLDVRRSLWPLRDAVNGLLRDESPLLGETTRLYLRDCYDHIVQVLDMVETYRELAGGLMDVYLSSLSNRMNEVMKVLTVIATIFIPLTFIAGIYGMNFERMPELKWGWAYPAVWGVMIFIAVVMLILFRRKGWLGGDQSP
jgi:magnesium transporter